MNTEHLPKSPDPEASGKLLPFREGAESSPAVHLVPLKDILRPYQEVSGVDLFNLRKADYAGMVTEEPAENSAFSGLEGYFDPAKRE